MRKMQVILFSVFFVSGVLSFVPCLSSLVSRLSPFVSDAHASGPGYNDTTSRPSSSVAPSFTGNVTLPGGIWGTDGNVGIGTTSPESKLEVYGGDIQTDFGSDTTRVVGIKGFSDGKTGVFRFADPNNQLETTFGDDMIMKAFHGIQLVGQSAGSQNNKSYILQVLDYVTPLFTILKSSGNVGIGDTTPGAHLVVGDDAGRGTADGTGDVYIQNDLEVDGGLYGAGATFDQAVTTGGLVTAGTIYSRADNGKHYFGAGNDASISYDGTNMLINPKEVGAGYVDLKGVLRTTEDDYSLFGDTTGIWGPLLPTQTMDRLYAAKSSGATSGTIRAGYFIGAFSGTSNSSLSVSGINAFAVTQSTATGDLAVTTNGGGLKNRYVVRHDGSGTVALANAVTSKMVVQNGVVTSANSYYSESPSVTAGKTLGEFAAFRSEGGAISGTLTTRYGLKIDTMDGGSTKWGVYVDTDDSFFGGKVVFTQTDGNEYVDSLADGYLDLGATIAVRMNGDVEASGDVTVDGGLYGAGATFTGTVTANAFSGDGSALTGITGAVSGLTANAVPMAQDADTLIDSGIYLSSGNVGIGTSTPVARLDMVGAGTTSATSSVVVRSATRSPLFSVLDNGNVGIGSLSPTERLDVAGNIKATGTITATNLSGTNTGDQDLSSYLTEETDPLSLHLDQTTSPQVITATDTDITASDEVYFGDVTDSSKLKKDTVQGILDLVPAPDLTNYYIKAYGVSTSSASTNAKSVTIPDYTISAGDIIAIKFTYGSTTTQNWDLSINGVWFYDIWVGGSTVTAEYLLFSANAVVLFYYDGTRMNVVNPTYTNPLKWITLAGTNERPAETIYGYKIAWKDGDNRYRPIIKTSGTTGNNDMPNTVGFMLGSNMVINSTGTTYGTSSTMAKDFTLIGDIGGAYNFNSAFTLWLPVYFKGTVNQTDGLFYLNQANGYTGWYTQTLPTSEDGFVYVYVGNAQSAYGVGLSLNHPAYEFKDGMIRLYGEAKNTHQDNFKEYFGAGNDASISYDGTNLVINPKEVGSGVLDVAGTVKATAFSGDGSALTGIVGAVSGLNAGRVPYAQDADTLVDSGIYLSSGNVGIGTVSPDALVSITSTAAQNLFRVNDNGSGDTSPVLIDEGGNVGIGIASPTAKLHVNGAINSTLLALQVMFSNPNQYQAISMYNTLAGVPSEVLRLSGITDTNYGVHFALFTKLNTGSGGAVTEKMRVTSSGNVGIGTSTPVARLDLVGAGTTSATSVLIVRDSNAAAKVTVLDNGNVGIGTTAPVANLQVGTGSPSLSADLSAKSALIIGNLEVDGKIYGDGSSLTGVPTVSAMSAGYIPRASSTTALTNSVMYDNGANVGIGTASPSYKLEVNGTLQADDIYSGDGSQGLSQDVVVKGSDGNNCTLTFKDGLLTAETCP